MHTEELVLGPIVTLVMVKAVAQVMKAIAVGAAWIL